MIKQAIQRTSLLFSAMVFALVLAVGSVAPPASANGIEGMEGFTQTYGWGIPTEEVTISHINLTTPEMTGVGAFHFDEGFTRMGVTFDGPIPSYKFEYVSAEEAGDCTGTEVPGNKFLKASFYSTTFNEDGVPPLGEIIIVDEGVVSVLALVCNQNLKGTFSYGLTEVAEVRAGEVTFTSPFGQQSIIAIDFKDPV